jgi:hypothetical protein
MIIANISVALGIKNYYSQGSQRDVVYPGAQINFGDLTPYLTYDHS